MDGYLLGVCEGIGDYIGIDPNIIRIAYIVGLLLTPNLLT